MNLRHALTALAADFDGVRALLAPDDYTRLVALVVEFSTETSPDVAADIAEDIAVLLTDALPAEHPVRRELAAPESRFSTGAGPDWGDLGTSLHDCLLSGAAPEAPRQVLEAEAVGEAEVRARGLAADDPDLIRLDHQDGDRWPAFQFGPSGQPLEVVRTVNRILDAADDPWGAADWWLGENAWLDGVPARLLDQVADQVLIDAARAGFSEV
ncbi:hypothetical protein HUO13_23425 [Saccharopolyspora erythraea]|uniref:hypothetical protein n=1 Tax=Saccharopolyspora erythraea TaxID=1836 RepID=UPI001BA79148|nr:hypothetical protein [Saccharopolyspora erythraea]QUH03382.1 hypothetical protein HUO13_23425 [Saccharopolyspora erythraea]